MTGELDDAFQVTLTLSEARGLDKEESSGMKKILDALDEAQGEVQMENMKVSYVLIKITDDRA